MKGTESYLSPELYQPGIKVLNCAETGIDLKKADTFALGVTLFTMVVGRAPFCTASKSDPYYRYLFFSKRKANFWKKHPSSHKIESLSSEFKSLIESLLSLNPKDRPDISDIKHHSWMNSHQPSHFATECEV